MCECVKRMAGGAEATGQEAERNECWTPTHGVVLPTSRMAFQFSNRPLWRHALRLTQGCLLDDPKSNQLDI